MCEEPHSVEVIHPTVLMQLTLTCSYKAYLPVLAVALLRLTVSPHGKLVPMQKTRLDYHDMLLSRTAITVPKTDIYTKLPFPSLKKARLLGKVGKYHICIMLGGESCREQAVIQGSSIITSPVQGTFSAEMRLGMHSLHSVHAVPGLRELTSQRLPGCF